MLADCFPVICVELGGGGTVYPREVCVCWQPLSGYSKLLLTLYLSIMRFHHKGCMRN